MVHNEKLKAGWQEDPDAMPVKFYLPHPRTVYFDPYSGEENGIPGKVIISHERTIGNIVWRYPYWSKRGGRDMNITVPFFMYIDKDVRYIEADGEPLLREKDEGNGKVPSFFDGTGIQPNIYHTVNLVHSYSGLGKSTAEGDLSQLAYGILRDNRSLLMEYTTAKSNIFYIIDRFTYPNKVLLLPLGAKAPLEQLAEWNASGGNWNVLEIPLEEGAKLEKDENLPPPQEVFQYIAGLEAELTLRNPPIFGGLTTASSSGREADIGYRSGLKRFTSVIDNSAQAWGAALGLAGKICETLPDWLPKGVHKKDWDGDYNCRVELRSDDPIETDRRRMLGSRLFAPDAQGMRQIDLETNLTDYQGYTEKRAKEIIANIMVDKITIESPVVAQQLGQMWAKEHAGEEELLALRMGQELGEGTPLGENTGGIGSQGGPPRRGNLKTSRGRDEIDVSLSQEGVRSRPSA